MDLNLVFEQSLLWSSLWIIVVIISVRVFPFTIEHDYPQGVRELAAFPAPTREHRQRGVFFGVVSFCFLFGLLIGFALVSYKGASASFANIFLHLWIICMVWNLIDLIIVDWLLICTFLFSPLLLPGTETSLENKDFKFHFKGFLKGLVVMTVIAFVFSTISYLILTIG